MSEGLSPEQLDSVLTEMEPPVVPELEAPSLLNAEQATGADDGAAERLAAAEAKLTAETGGTLHELEDKRDVTLARVDANGNLVELFNVTKNESFQLNNKEGQKQDILDDSAEADKAKHALEPLWKDGFMTYRHEGDPLSGTASVVLRERELGDGSRIIEWETRTYISDKKDVPDVEIDNSPLVSNPAQLPAMPLSSEPQASLETSADLLVQSQDTGQETAQTLEVLQVDQDIFSDNEPVPVVTEQNQVAGDFVEPVTQQDYAVELIHSESPASVFESSPQYEKTELAHKSPLALDAMPLQHVDELHFSAIEPPHINVETTTLPVMQNHELMTNSDIAPVVTQSKNQISSIESHSVIAPDKVPLYERQTGQTIFSEAMSIAPVVEITSPPSISPEINSMEKPLEQSNPETSHYVQETFVANHQGQAREVSVATEFQQRNWKQENNTEINATEVGELVERETHSQVTETAVEINFPHDEVVRKIQQKIFSVESVRPDVPAIEIAKLETVSPMVKEPELAVSPVEALGAFVPFIEQPTALEIAASEVAVSEITGDEIIRTKAETVETIETGLPAQITLAEVAHLPRVEAPVVIAADQAEPPLLEFFIDTSAAREQLAPLVQGEIHEVVMAGERAPDGKILDAIIIKNEAGNITFEFRAAPTVSQSASEHTLLSTFADYAWHIPTTVTAAPTRIEIELGALPETQAAVATTREHARAASIEAEMRLPRRKPISAFTDDDFTTTASVSAPRPRIEAERVVA